MDEREEHILIGQLRELFAADEVPGTVVEAARAALGWRRIDAELAELLADSALDDADALAIARGGSAHVRSVSFSAGETLIELEIRHDGTRRTLLGQLSPPGERTIEVQYAAGGDRDPVRTDRHGRFRVELEDGGLLRLRLPDGDGPIETSWLAV